MMYDMDFLKKLDLQKNKTIYARITSLQFNESPIETIEGKVTQGSINIDGASAVRRTCSLTMVAQDINISDYYWGLKTKFKLEIGVKNTIDFTYPDIIWFPQGIFVITSFSTALSINNYTINIQGKDKMCLLNGEVGGTLNSQINFGSFNEVSEDDIYTITKFPIKDIIRESVHQYAGEPFHNIIINDIDDLGLELLEYRYDLPLYIIRENNEDTYFNGTFNPDLPCWTVEKEKTTLSKIKTFDPLVGSLIELDQSTNFYLEDPNLSSSNKQLYCAAKIEYGQTGGYRTTPLTYPGDLIANVGEPLTSVLDKIKNMLGEFEYFYDLDGRFIFQKKKTYINTVWTPILDNGENIYVNGLEYSNSFDYIFSGGELITVFNNAPNLNNLRNDFSVWGVRKSVTGASLPVHMRYAIDQKPISYTSITVTAEELKNYNTIYNSNLQPQEGRKYSIDDYDWREIIYQMAMDYNKFNHLDSFELKIIEANKNDNLYTTGQTGYEQYYVDMEGFWRQLYKIELTAEDLENYYYYLTDENDEIIIENGKELLHPHKFWNKAVYESPETLRF